MGPHFVKYCLGKRSKKRNRHTGGCVALVREIKIEFIILVRKHQGSKSRGKYRPRQGNVKIGVKREICCWSGETLITKFVCG